MKPTEAEVLRVAKDMRQDVTASMQAQGEWYPTMESNWDKLTEVTKNQWLGVARWHLRELAKAKGRK